jgi:hypothetical protein
VTALVVVLVVLYVLAGACVGNLATEGYGRGWVRWALLCALIWPVLSVYAIDGLVRELWKARR